MKIGMTGNRNGISEQALNKLKELLKSIEITEAHHGDCTGADENFHQIMVSFLIKIIIHPPDKNICRAYCQGDEIRKEKSYLDIVLIKTTEIKILLMNATLYWLFLLQKLKLYVQELGQLLDMLRKLIKKQLYFILTELQVENYL